MSPRCSQHHPSSRFLRSNHQICKRLAQNASRKKERKKLQLGARTGQNDGRPWDPEKFG